MTLFRKMVAVLAAAIAFTAAAASAQELKIGLKTEPSSLDPQYHALTPNLQGSVFFVSPGTDFGQRLQSFQASGGNGNYVWTITG